MKRLHFCVSKLSLSTATDKRFALKRQDTHSRMAYLSFRKEGAPMRLLIFWPDFQTASAIREQMEWEGKGGLLKTSFKRPQLTACGSFFQPSLWEGSFTKALIPPYTLGQRAPSGWWCGNVDVGW